MRLASVALGLDHWLLLSATGELPLMVMVLDGLMTGTLLPTRVEWAESTAREPAKAVGA